MDQVSPCSPIFRLHLTNPTQQMMDNGKMKQCQQQMKEQKFQVIQAVTSLAQVMEKVSTTLFGCWFINDRYFVLDMQTFLAFDNKLVRTTLLPLVRYNIQVRADSTASHCAFYSLPLKVTGPIPKPSNISNQWSSPEYLSLIWDLGEWDLTVGGKTVEVEFTITFYRDSDAESKTESICTRITREMRWSGPCPSEAIWVGIQTICSMPELQSDGAMHKISPLPDLDHPELSDAPAVQTLELEDAAEVPMEIGDDELADTASVRKRSRSLSPETGDTCPTKRRREGSVSEGVDQPAPERLFEDYNSDDGTASDVGDVRSGDDYEPSDEDEAYIDCFSIVGEERQMVRFFLATQ